MSINRRFLIISVIVLVAVFLVLYFSPILKSDPIPIEFGVTYQDTIMPKDAPDFKDKDYRGHFYSLTVFSDDVCLYEVSSLSDGAILVVEHYYDDRILVLHVGAGDSATKEYTYKSAGLKRIYIEALADELPAEYSFKVTKVDKPED